MIKYLKNSLGVTLFEMTVSILVGSMVLVTLMSVLTMTVRAKMQFDYESRMINESYLISEQLKYSLANSLEKQFTYLESPTSEGFLLQIDYCDVNIEGVLECSKNGDFSPYLLEYNSDTDILTFDGERLHSNNIFLVDGTSFTFFVNGVEANISTLPERFTGELLMVMNIQIVTTDGARLDPKEYRTMLMFTNYT